MKYHLVNISAEKNKWNLSIQEYDEDRYPCVNAPSPLGYYWSNNKSIKNHLIS